MGELTGIQVTNTNEINETGEAGLQCTKYKKCFRNLDVFACHTMAHANSMNNFSSNNNDKAASRNSRKDPAWMRSYCSYCSKVFENMSEYLKHLTSQEHVQMAIERQRTPLHQQISVNNSQNQESTEEICWLKLGLVVRLNDPRHPRDIRFQQGLMYDVDVESRTAAVWIQGIINPARKVIQSHLETVLPSPGEKAIILAGPLQNQVVRLLSMEEDKARVEIIGEFDSSWRRRIYMGGVPRKFMCKYNDHYLPEEVEYYPLDYLKPTY